MRTSSEKHLVEQLQLVLTLCGKVSSSYTMLHQGFWDDAALFGHFFTFRSPPVKRRGFQTCGSCRVGRLSPLALHPNCLSGGCLYQFTPPGMDCARRTPRSGERGS